MQDNEYILGFKVSTLNKKDILGEINNTIVNNKHRIIYNINPLITVNFYKNKTVKKAFNCEELNIPDGIGIVMASKIKKGKIKERITGIELFLDICKVAAKENKKVFLYGSKEGVAEKTKEVLKKKYPNIKIVGCINGYVSEDEALKEIKSSKPNILFVGLGSPKQEEFIINHKEELDSINIIMPIGGSMDVISGKVKAAPEFYKKHHLEWLYRLVKEPHRLIQDIKLIKFLLLVLFRNSWYNERAEEKIWKIWF